MTPTYQTYSLEQILKAVAAHWGLTENIVLKGRGEGHGARIMFIGLANRYAAEMTTKKFRETYGVSHFWTPRMIDEGKDTWVMRMKGSQYAQAAKIILERIEL